LKEREKFKKALMRVEFIKFKKSRCSLDLSDLSNPDEMMKEFEREKKKAKGCDMEDCLLDQFQFLPITYLCNDVIEYMAIQYREIKNRGIKLSWTKNPIVLKKNCVQNNSLIVRPWN
jgi:hypothetical protein